MRKISSITIAVLTCAILLFSGCSGSSSAALTGTWDLQFGESSTGGDAISKENVAAMRSLGLDAYLNLDEGGSLVLVMFDQALRGNWKSTGDNAANATLDGQGAKIVLMGEILKLEQQDTVLYFRKGDPKDNDAVDRSNPSSQSNSKDSSAGLSEMVVKGALFDMPSIVIDSELCTVNVDGAGVDKWGDPGFNLQLTNKADTSIDIWIRDSFTVGGIPVKVYLCETVPSGRSITAFMQFDGGDLGSTSPSALSDVSGTLIVDDDKNNQLAEYAFVL